jgi:hypothetical protein
MGEIKVVFNDDLEVIAVERDGKRSEAWCELSTQPLSVKGVIVPLEILLTVDGRRCFHQRPCRYIWF